MLDTLKRLRETVKKPESSVPNEQILVGLDIGTEFVKALIARVRGDELDVIGVGRAHQGLTDMQSGAIADIAGVVANCDKALSEAEAQAGVSGKAAVIGIAGELVKGTTTTVHFKRGNAEEPISMAEMEHIIQVIQKRAYEQARASLSLEIGSKDVDVKLVNSAIVSIQIDGYKVTNPVSFQGRDVRIQLYTAFAPMIHIGALEHTARELDMELIAVAAEPFAVARAVIGNDASSQFSAILVDVGGGTTDIAVVNDGGVEGTKMFGIGGRSFTRTLAQDLGWEFDKAEALKVRLSSHRLPAEQVQRAAKSLQKTLDVWLDGVELALGEFEQLDHLPSQLLLCGGGASLEKLVEMLEQSDWYKQLPFTKKPSVQHIQPKQVVGVHDATNELQDHTFITAMGLLRVGLDTLHSVPEKSGSVKQKLDKLLSI